MKEYNMLIQLTTLGVDNLEIVEFGKAGIQTGCKRVKEDMSQKPQYI